MLAFSDGVFAIAMTLLVVGITVPTLYAISVGIISGMEVVLFRHAYRNGLLRRDMPEEVFRWGAMMSLAPLAFFALSIPLAFWSTTVAVASWLLIVPFSIRAEARKPEGAAEFFR